MHLAGLCIHGEVTSFMSNKSSPAKDLKKSRASYSPFHLIPTPPKPVMFEQIKAQERRRSAPEVNFPHAEG